MRYLSIGLSIFRVITGVALKKFQGVFHLLIVQRELQGYGMVNSTTPPWNTFNSIDYFRIHDPLVRENVDYFTLTWENRSINLDVVEVPTGKVITGVRFRNVNGAITLQVRATEFDFTTGKLKNIGNSLWYMNNNKNNVEFVIEQPDIPINSMEKSILLPVSNIFVKFGPTDRVKDISQTTIPFIDAQLVESHNPSPLSGVGLYYKGLPGYGGFIAPKVLNYNLGAHIITPK